MKMENGPSRTQVALEALQTGQDMDAALDSLEGTGSADTQETELEESTIESESQEETLDEDVEESGEESESSEVEGDVEELVVNGRKLKVDFKDREKLKKYVRMAGGARKWQAERDEYSKQLSEIKPKYEESLKFEQAIETAFDQGGIEGLVNLVAGKEDAFQKLMDEQYEIRRAKEDASPAELERIELQEQLAKERRQRERIQKEREEELNRTKAEREEAEQRKIENLMHPAFNKYRFTGKIEDPSLASDVDSMIWSKAINAISEIPEEVQLTEKVVDREFRKAANSLRKLVERESTKKVTKAIGNKKKEAATKVAIAAKKGVANQTNSNEITDAIAKNDLRSAFSMFRNKNK
jgi:hypothetical protein